MKCIFGSVFAAATVSTGFGADVSQELANAKNRPVSKVITVLKDMLKQLEKEGEDDEEIYEKMACWCETNDARLGVRDGLGLFTVIGLTPASHGLVKLLVLAGLLLQLFQHVVQDVDNFGHR